MLALSPYFMDRAVGCLILFVVSMVVVFGDRPWVKKP